MMFKLLICLTFALTFVIAAPKSQKVALQLLDDDEQVDSDEDDVNERISALYVKDSESGQLRFLGGTNRNTAINQFITSQQDLLEQLRPTSTTGTGTTGTGSSANVNPIVVNLSGSSSTVSGSNNLANIASQTSPIGDLLPQIIAGSLFNGQTVNRRRVNNRRRGGNRRRPAGNTGPVYVIRPNRG